MARRAFWPWVLLALSPPLIYAACALLFAFIPVNADFRMPADGELVYLRSNGVHADLVLPTRSAVHDFGAEFPAVHTKALREPLAWIAFGWGDREFMIETPTWRDLRARTAANALLGRGSGAMHVEYIDVPERYRALPVRVSPAQYARLVELVREGFARDAHGQPQRIGQAAFGRTDAFYVATVDWSIRLTCNEWVRRILAGAGIRAPLWAPFERALFWQLERAPRDERGVAGGEAGQLPGEPGRRLNMPQPSIVSTISRR